MIDRLIEALNQKAGMSAEEIADIFWLAVQMQESESEPEDTDFSSGEDWKDSGNNTGESEPITSPERQSRVSNSEKKETKRGSKKQTGNIYPQNPEQTSKTDLSFKTPNAPSLREPLILARALKPLMRRVPAGTNLVIDEIATSERIANEGLWLPVLRPTLEPWLDLELVVDESISMQIWRQTIGDLEKLLKNYGIFRDVRVWGLIADDGEGVQIRRGIGGRAKDRSPRSPKELIDGSGRRLVLVASDCVSPLWRDGKVTATLALWANRVPTAIIQMLPQWLWERTALGRATEVRLRGLTPGASNGNLIAKVVSLWDELSEERRVKVPVFTLEADKAATWAQMLSGKGSVWTSGVAFELDETRVDGEDSLFNLDYSRLTAEQRVQAFRVTASPMARKLAGLLAAAPVITLPVVRLIREVLLKDSLQVNVAEVFLGGLLKPLSEIKPETNPDEVLYDFMDGVRELLVDSVPSGYVLDVVDEVSKYVAEKVGLSLESFAAVLRNPQEVGDGRVAEKVGYFATVTAGVLRRLGGEYVKVADELELSNFVADPKSTTYIKLTSLTLYAFHLRNGINLEVVPEASQLWERLARFGEALRIEKLRNIRQKLICYRDNQYYPEAEDLQDHLEAEDPQETGALNLLPGRENVLRFSVSPELKGLLCPFRLNDTYAIDFTISSKEAISLELLNSLNPKYLLLPSQVKASLGQTLFFWAEPLEDEGNYQSLADACVAQLIPKTEHNFIELTAEGSFLGNPIFEYESSHKPQVKRLHILVCFERKQVALEQIDKLLEPMFYVLWLRHRILYAYEQWQLCAKDAKLLSAKIEEYWLNKYVPDFSELANMNILYTNHMQNLRKYQTMIEVDELSYITQMEKTTTFPDSNFKFLDNFLSLVPNKFYRQIEIDLRYLEPGKERLQQLQTTAIANKS